MTNHDPTQNEINRPIPEPVWEPPGLGQWDYDPSHSPPAPTLLMRRIGAQSATTAYQQVFEQFGLPLKTLQVEFVNGKMFRSLVPLVEADPNRSAPPSAAIWLAARLHPEFRRRNATARKTINNRLFLDPIEHWHAVERQEWIDRNLAFQDEDLSTLDDDELAGHVERVANHTLEGWTRHHQLHATDLGPIGALLARTNEWGLDPVEVMSLLQGASDATTEPARLLAEVAQAVVDGGTNLSTLASLDDVRVASPEAGRLLDDYLRVFGWRTVTSYDIEASTTNELPDITLNTIRSAALPPKDRVEIDDQSDGESTAGRTEALADQLNPKDRPEFTQKVSDARLAYGLRDDNGPLTAEWPMGLIRRAYLAADRRLNTSGRFETTGDAFELDADELAKVLKGSATPDEATITQRRQRRQWEATLEVPSMLGPKSDPPSPKLLPRWLRQMVEAVTSTIALLEPESESRAGKSAEVTQISDDDQQSGGNTKLSGLGIGTEPYKGRALVATKPEDALERMMPGDVLVAAWTAPTYNTVMAMAGGFVVQEGGLLSHAAVLARELDIPAVIGVAGAMTTIGDGDLIQVDPQAGEVTIMARADK